MFRYSDDDHGFVLQGDCLDEMARLGADSIDAIVTDPPYGLSFMDKEWDHGVPGEHFWREALRVAKPGAHLLAFGGTRTYHRLACAIEDAGWEIRDCLGWLYGQGFPKSLDVSKAIDKAGPLGQSPYAEFASHYEERRLACGLTHAAICEHGGWYRSVNHGGSSVNWANAYGYPTVAQWEVLQPLLGLDERWAEPVKREEYEREVIGQRDGNLLAVAPGQDNDRSATTLDITAPATEAAQRWQGWGTALKPAWEPIILARKPLTTTVAGNVQRWGTGALNIDGCRVAWVSDTERSEVNARTAPNSRHLPENSNGSTGWGSGRVRDRDDLTSPAGRWPANIIHDGSDEVLSVFPGEGEKSESRFFYCAKASKKDRGEGNTHPTVKPTALMDYLVRLVTPPSGTVLDPFAGSGSTGIAAMRENRRFILIEQDTAHCDIIVNRIKKETPDDQL